MSSSTEDPHPLKARVAKFPTQPGVYLMKNFDGEYIYIGKAKDLRARVRSYFGVGDGRVQIQYLLKRVASIEHIVTHSEEEALLLERELIHRHKPRYNIKLKDDKSYVSIRINTNHPFPRLEMVRRVIPDGAAYYGPFTSTAKLRDVLEIIKRVTPLRTCADAVFSNRTRPCLEYEIKRCSGPCCIAVDPEQYGGWLKEAVMILEGKIDPTIDSLEKQMTFAAEDLKFEAAAVLRDRIETLKSFKDRGQESIAFDFTGDFFSLYREDDMAVVSVLRTRGGRMSEADIYPFKDVQIPDEELLEAVIPQYYEAGHDVPGEIIVPFPIANEEFLKTYFRETFDSEPIFLTPEQGPKHRLLRIGEINARQAFQTKFFSEARFDAISQQLVERFSLRQAPRRIECVDISNFQGSDIVGAIVSFVDGVPDRKRYRRYNISFSGEGPNDFEAIHEVVSRRLSGQESLPDLLIIDGGAQQLQRALAARDALGVQLDIISLAKIKVVKKGTSVDVAHKPERIFIEGGGASVALDETDPLTHFLQRVRDEVHRYVITFHREKRKSRVFRSVLDDIKGLGPERRKRLLAEFRTVQSIAVADVMTIARVGRMPGLLAEKVKSVTAAASKQEPKDSVKK